MIHVYNLRNNLLFLYTFSKYVWFSYAFFLDSISFSRSIFYSCYYICMLCIDNFHDDYSWGAESTVSQLKINYVKTKNNNTTKNIFCIRASNRLSSNKIRKKKTCEFITGRCTYPKDSGFIYGSMHECSVLYIWNSQWPPVIFLSIY